MQHDDDDAIITDFSLFPTRLVTLQFSQDDVGAMNAQLRDLFASGDGFSGGGEDFDMHPDSLNLLHLAGRCPAIVRLREMFLAGLRRWLQAERLSEQRLEVDMVLFSNYAGKGEMTLAHNHNADVVGIYYVTTATYAGRDAVAVPDPEGVYDYFAAEDGVLVLHDPRFNANLAGVRARDYVKVYPRPGLMLVFPGYLWHSVTPHQCGDFRRLALSVNFTLRWPRPPGSAETWPVSG